MMRSYLFMTFTKTGFVAIKLLFKVRTYTFLLPAQRLIDRGNRPAEWRKSQVDLICIGLYKDVRSWPKADGQERYLFVISVSSGTMIYLQKKACFRAYLWGCSGGIVSFTGW